MTANTEEKTFGPSIGSAVTRRQHGERGLVCMIRSPRTPNLDMSGQKRT